MFKQIRERKLVKHFSVALNSVYDLMVSPEGEVSNPALFVSEIIDIYEKAIVPKIPNVLKGRLIKEFSQESTHLLKNTLTRKLLDSKLGLHDFFLISEILSPITDFIESNGGIDEISSNYERLFLHVWYFHDLERICTDLEMSKIDGDNESLYRYAVTSYSQSNFPKKLLELKKSRTDSYLKLKQLCRLIEPISNLKIRIYFGSAKAFYGEDSMPSFGFRINDSFVESTQINKIHYALFYKPSESDFDIDIHEDWEDPESIKGKLNELNQEAEVRFEIEHDYFEHDYELKLDTSISYAISKSGKTPVLGGVPFIFEASNWKNCFKSYFPEKEFSTTSFKIEFGKKVNHYISENKALRALVIDNYSIKGIEYYLDDKIILSYKESFNNYCWPTYNLSQLNLPDEVKIETHAIMDDYLLNVAEDSFYAYSKWSNGSKKHVVIDFHGFNEINGLIEDIDQIEQYFCSSNYYSEITHKLYSVNGKSIDKIIVLLNIQRNSGVFIEVISEKIENRSDYTFITKQKLRENLNQMSFINSELIESLHEEDLIAISTIVNNEGADMMIDGFFGDLSTFDVNNTYCIIEHDVEYDPSYFLVHSDQGFDFDESYSSEVDYSEIRDRLNRSSSFFNIIKTDRIGDFIQDGKLSTAILDS